MKMGGKNMMLFLALVTVNIGAFYLDYDRAAGSANIFVVAFSIYGLAHIEWMMARVTFWVLLKTGEITARGS